MQPLVDFCEWGAGRAHSHYTLNLRRWRAVYPEVRVLDYAMLRRDPEEYLTCILRYIGAEVPDTYEGYPIEGRVHKSIPYPVPVELLSEIDRIFDPMIESMAPGLPFSVREWLRPVAA
jgi:hypothetical protein